MGGGGWGHPASSAFQVGVPTELIKKQEDYWARDAYLRYINVSEPDWLKVAQALHNRCVPGATIAKLTDVVFCGHPGSRYNAVVLHVGGNNVVPGSTPLSVVSQYKFLIEAVKDKYPAVVIYLSAIIPKPYELSASFFIQLINELSCIIAARMGYIFLATYKQMRAGQSVSSVLFNRSDPLHINGAGVSQMGSFFREQTDPWQTRALREQNLLRAQKLMAKLAHRGYPSLQFI